VESEPDVHLLQDLIVSCSRRSLGSRTTLSVSCIRAWSDLGWVRGIVRGAAGVGCIAETYLNDRLRYYWDRVCVHRCSLRTAVWEGRIGAWICLSRMFPFWIGNVSESQHPVNRCMYDGQLDDAFPIVSVEETNLSKQRARKHTMLTKTAGS
jgi:hypothetical protein